jgi:Lysine methyltransferase
VTAERRCKSMVLTETDDVLTNLKDNLATNETTLNVFPISAHALDWTTYKSDATRSNGALAEGTADTLLGTDVIFAPHLVEPLLKAAHYLSHPGTVWYLCVQIRCAASHRLFLETAPDHGFHVEDISSEALVGDCTWGRELECVLFRITRLPTKTLPASE